jgi:hypothetical protein
VSDAATARLYLADELMISFQGYYFAVALFTLPRKTLPIDHHPK